jgi:CheY-like chemotaxis protein
MAKVLIIDDDPVYSGMMQQRLIRAGHQADVHNGPFGATVALRKSGADLVILDVFMPGLDGPALLELMRKDGLGSRPRVVFCSSMDPEPLSELAERHQANGWIPKSASRAHLMECLERVLAHSRRSGDSR